jgi:hypothetical protein
MPTSFRPLIRTDTSKQEPRRGRDTERKPLSGISTPPLVSEGHAARGRERAIQFLEEDQYHGYEHHHHHENFSNPKANHIGIQSGIVQLLESARSEEGSKRGPMAG